MDSSFDYESTRRPMIGTMVAIIPAAGIGERFGSKVPKQFSMIMKKPLIYYTLRNMANIEWIDGIIVLVPDGYQELMNQSIPDDYSERIHVEIGEKTRHRSIRKGLVRAKELYGDVEIVIVQDGVRPFIEEEFLETLVGEAFQHGAVGPVRPLVSTVVATSESGFLEHSLDRSKYRMSEMPQVFRYDLIMSAYSKSLEYDLDYGTECLHLVSKYCGASVKLIEGPEYLWKVTYLKDYYATERLVKENELIDICIFSSSKTETSNVISLLDFFRAERLRAYDYNELNYIDEAANSFVLLIDSIEIGKKFLEKIQIKFDTLLQQQHQQQLQLQSATMLQQQERQQSPQQQPLLAPLQQLSQPAERSFVFCLLWHQSASVEEIRTFTVTKAKEWPNAIVTSVLLQQSDVKDDKVCQLVKALVYDRCDAFSSQVFYL